MEWRQLFGSAATCCVCNQSAFRQFKLFWRCGLTRDSKYVVLKVYVTSQERNHELNVYDRMNSVETNHPGRRFIRKLLDYFSIEGPHGRHTCLVHEPLGISANELMKWVPGQTMTLEDLKPCIRQLLIALDFLHSVSHIAHTGRILSPSTAGTAGLTLGRHPTQELATSCAWHQDTLRLWRKRDRKTISEKGAQRPNNLYVFKFPTKQRNTSSEWFWWSSIWRGRT